MKRTMLLGAAMLAALALVAADAVSVSASGHEFVASKLGKTKGKGTSSQVFKTSAGTVECAEVTGAGEITALKSATHKEVLTFKECTGFGGGIKVSPANFEYNANGPAKLEKRVTLQPEGVSCQVFIEPQTVESLGYENSSGNLTSNATILKIHSRGTGGVCGAENTTGVYSGTIVAELEGGTLEWK